MRLKVDIGNPETEEWEEVRYIEMEDYKNVFERQNPSIPYPAGLTLCLTVDDYKLELRGTDSVWVFANYSIETDDFTLAVKGKDKNSFCQVMGKSNVKEGAGISLIFTAPNENYPVEIQIVSD